MQKLKQLFKPAWTSEPVCNSWDNFRLVSFKQEYCECGRSALNRLDGHTIHAERPLDFPANSYRQPIVATKRIVNIRVGRWPNSDIPGNDSPTARLLLQQEIRTSNAPRIGCRGLVDRAFLSNRVQTTVQYSQGTVSTFYVPNRQLYFRGLMNWLCSNRRCVCKKFSNLNCFCSRKWS